MEPANDRPFVGRSVAFPVTQTSELGTAPFFLEERRMVYDKIGPAVRLRYWGEWPFAPGARFS